MNVKQYTLPKGRLAYPTLTPELRELIDDTAEHTKGKPWIAAYHVARDFHKMAATSLDAGTPPSAAEVENAAAMANVMVAALLERMGADP